MRERSRHRPARERMEVLDSLVPRALHVEWRIVSDVEAGELFVAEALRAGHEGALAQSLDATYEADRRGAAWLKLKPAHTADLVVLAAEWGSGRRRGWLSNLHLGARDEQGGFVSVRPELVVEIAFEDLQQNSQYPGGLALRFARVKAHRPDKRPNEADTLTTLKRWVEGARGAGNR